MTAPASAGAAALARLAFKYETLTALRRARAEGAPPPPREVFQALAAEFPGCLVELDMLPLEEIEARRSRLAAAAAGGPEEAWMTWLAGYHAWLAVALRIKRRLARGRAPDTATIAAIARETFSHAVAVDEDFVRAVASPPGGRVKGVVLARLAALHGAEADAIKAAIFPRARRRRDAG